MEAAVDCLQRHGYRETTIARVVAEAGVSSGAMIHHFPTKLDLFAATYDHIFEVILQRYAQVGHEHEGLRERWHAIVDCFWHDKRLDRYAVADMELSMASRADEALNTRFEVNSAERIERMRALWKELFAEAADPAPHIIVELTMYLVRGLWTVRMSPQASAWTDAHFGRWMKLVEPLIAAAGPAEASGERRRAQRGKGNSR